MQRIEIPAAPEVRALLLEVAEHQTNVVPHYQAFLARLLAQASDVIMHPHERRIVAELHARHVVGKVVYVNTACPEEPCPYCGEMCAADWCDVGVGWVQSGPFHCMDCMASEIGPYDEARVLSEAEETLGWYAPGAKPGSSANVLDGKIVGHKEALEVYRATYPLSATESGRKLLGIGC